MKNKKIIGIGNAIIDIVCEIDDDFLAQNNLIKGSMSLINKELAQKLEKLQVVKITSGGSVANSIALIAQLQGNSAFIGKVGLDDFGKKFINEIQKIGANFLLKNYSENLSAKSFILVSKDGQRTMCTFLGCASQIYQEDIDENEIKQAEILYLEGYLWDQDYTIQALQKAIFLAKKHNVKIAFSLSDFFCVARHKEDFLQLIENDLDILFANEAEILELLKIQDLDKEIQKLHNFFAKNPKLIVALTRSEKGCIIFQNLKHIEIKANKVEKIIDTTGAGDCFAGGFLFGLTDGVEAEKAAIIGNEFASKIIQKFGARFDEFEI